MLDIENLSKEELTELISRAQKRLEELAPKPKFGIKNFPLRYEEEYDPTDHHW